MDEDMNIDDDTGVGNGTSSALDRIIEQEFEESLYKFASFLSILQDKELTSIAVFSILMKDKHARAAFKMMTQIDNDRTIVLKLLKMYPNFCKSKVVKRLVEEHVN